MKRTSGIKTKDLLKPANMPGIHLTNGVDQDAKKIMIVMGKDIASIDFAKESQDLLEPRPINMMRRSPEENAQVHRLISTTPIENTIVMELEDVQQLGYARICHQKTKIIMNE